MLSLTLPLNTFGNLSTSGPLSMNIVVNGNSDAGLIFLSGTGCSSSIAAILTPQ